MGRGGGEVLGVGCRVAIPHVVLRLMGLSWLKAR